MPALQLAPEREHDAARVVDRDDVVVGLRVDRFLVLVVVFGRLLGLRVVEAGGLVLLFVLLMMIVLWSRECGLRAAVLGLWCGGVVAFCMSLVEREMRSMMFVRVIERFIEDLEFSASLEGVLVEIGVRRWTSRASDWRFASQRDAK